MGGNLQKINSIISIFISILTVGITLYINVLLGTVLLLLLLIYFIYSKRHLLYALQGAKAYNSKDYTLALNQYKKAFKTKNASGSIINNYLIMELKHGDLPLTEDIIDLTLSSRNFSSHDLINLKTTKALILWKNNKINDALLLLKEMLKTSKNTYLYETLTTLLLVNGHTYESLNIIKEGLNYTNSSNVLQSNYGEANFILGNYIEAQKTFATLIEDNVSFLEPYYYTSIILKKSGNINEAIDLLKRTENMNNSLVSLIKKDDVLTALESLLLVTTEVD